jgi:hypothetical protein
LPAVANLLVIALHMIFVTVHVGPETICLNLLICVNLYVNSSFEGFLDLVGLIAKVINNFSKMRSAAPFLIFKNFDSQSLSTRYNAHSFQKKRWETGCRGRLF